MLPIRMPDAIRGHTAPITGVAISPCGPRLATASYDGTVIIWNYDDEPEMVSRIRHRRLVNAVAWSPVHPDLLASASADKTAVVWRVGSKDETSIVSVLARHTDDVNSIAWMPSGSELICVSEDGRATQWDAMTGVFLREVTSHAAHCMDVSVSRDGLIATVGEDGLIAVVGGGAAGQRQITLECSIEGCAWSPSGKVLAAACDDGSVLLLDANLDRLQRIAVSTSAVRSVAWGKNDSSLVVGAYDGAIYLIERDSTEVVKLQEGWLWPRSLATGGNRLVAGTFGSTPAVFDIATARLLSAPPMETHGPNALVSHAGTLHVGCDSGRLLQVPIGDDRIAPDSAVASTKISDSPVLVLAADAHVTYIGTYSGVVIRTMGGRTSFSENLGAPVTSLSLVRGYLIAGTYNGELILLDPVQLTIGDRAVRHGGSVKALARVSDDVFAAASTDYQVTVGSFHERVTLWRHGNLVNSVACLDGEVVASAARDHTVKVGLIRRDEDAGWTVTKSRTLLGPDESVKAVAVLGNSRRPVVLAGSYDFRLYYWLVDWTEAGSVLRSGSVLAEFDQAVSHMVAVRRDLAAVASWDGRVALVSLSPDGTPTMTDQSRVSNLLDLVSTAQTGSGGYT